MPTKLGKGGAGQEDFDPETGEYTAGSTIEKRGDKYYVHGELRSRKITKEEFDNYKNQGYKEIFDEDFKLYDVKEANKIMGKNQLNKFYLLGNLVNSEGSAKEKTKIGKEIYNELAEQKAEELLNTFKKQEKYNVELSNKNANSKLFEVFNDYTYTDENGKKHFNGTFDDYKKFKKEIKSYENNCQRCVMAWYLNYLGYSVEALPSDSQGRWDWYIKDWLYRKGSNNEYIDMYSPNLGTGRDWDLSGFIIPEGTEYDYRGNSPDDQYNSIKNIVESSPDKSVYFCSVAWKKEGSHVFIILNDGGTMKMIEPQWNRFEDKSLFNRVKPERTKLIRVNDFKLNGDTLPFIVKGVNNND